MLSITALSLAGVALLGGCGYHQGSRTESDDSGNYQWRSLYREEYQSVAVPIFTNLDFRRGIEMDLTKAVVQQIESRTPYKVEDRSKADTILEGEIVSASFDTLSEGRKNATPQDQLLTLQINFTWKDLHTGKILCERRQFEQSVAYYPTLGEGEFVGRQQAIERLAIAIVQELQADW
jgi:hypothetical protein